MSNRRPVVTVYVRAHRDCRYSGQKNKAFVRDCACVKWLRYSGDVCLCGYLHKGRQHRISTETRTYGIAEEQRVEFQRRLDTGDTSPLPSPAARRTLATEVESYLLSKKTDNVTEPTLRKLKQHLNLLVTFMTARGRFFASDITATDVIEFRSSWTSWGTLSRQKAQQSYRGFFRLVCKDNLKELLDVMRTIKLSKADRSRLEPRPFTEDELKRLLEQVPQTFNGARAVKMTALIHLMTSSGLAIRDAIQLERANIEGGWLRLNRQKSSKAVAQRLDPDLVRELLAVAGDRYFFWDGEILATSAVGLWQTYLRKLMKDAGVYVQGALSHRFRDTAVDWWLGMGRSTTEIAAMIGDQPRIVERHYLKLMSERMNERLAAIPTRSWGVGGQE